MTHERFPWTEIERGAEPRMRPDFTTAVIERASIARGRRRHARAALAVATGLAVMLGTLISLHGQRANNPTLARKAHTLEAVRTTAELTSEPWGEEPGDVLTLLMPAARQARSFDSYYGSDWGSYPSWASDSAYSYASYLAR